MTAPFHVKRKGFLRTFVRSFIGPVVVALGALLLFGAFRGTAAFWVLFGSALLTVLWWGLR